MALAWYFTLCTCHPCLFAGNWVLYICDQLRSLKCASERGMELLDVWRAIFVPALPRVHQVCISYRTLVFNVAMCIFFAYSWETVDAICVDWKGWYEPDMWWRFGCCGWSQVISLQRVSDYMPCIRCVHSQQELQTFSIIQAWQDKLS